MTAFINSVHVKHELLFCESCTGAVVSVPTATVPIHLLGCHHWDLSEMGEIICPSTGIRYDWNELVNALTKPHILPREPPSVFMTLPHLFGVIVVGLAMFAVSASMPTPEADSTSLIQSIAIAVTPGWVPVLVGAALFFFNRWHGLDLFPVSLFSVFFVLIGLGCGLILADRFEGTIIGSPPCHYWAGIVFGYASALVGNYTRKPPRP